MNCVVTAGPTYEKMDEVRRLTNLSTGRLGTELANHLVSRGHQVTLLIGEQASHNGDRRAQTVETFSTTKDLHVRLQRLATQNIDAVFHAAAVSDFMFGRIWQRLPNGELSEIKAGKISTRQGSLMAELLPTPKIISELRAWYPAARLIGWKFEVDGDRAQAIRAAQQQMAKCLTDACVVNGPGYGAGFGLIAGGRQVTHLADQKGLFESLEQLLSR